MSIVAPVPVVGGFESTYMPHHDQDIFETTEHDMRWRDDLALIRDAGVRRVRYPIRWHRIESEEGQFDWSDTDDVMTFFHDHGFTPIVDLLHHTSYPKWLHAGFGDSRFPTAYVRYAREFALRYPWVAEYTLFNEPFSTLFLAGHEGIWPPYRTGLQGFVDLISHVLPAVAEASRLYRELLPEAKHVWVDTCEHPTSSDADGAEYAAMANERRFLVLDAFLGRDYDPHGPMAALLSEVGGQRLLGIESGGIDVLGLDYYAHCQWDFSAAGGSMPTLTPLPFADLIDQYWQRYGKPCLVTETNIRGRTSDRASWFKYVLEQCEVAQERGIPIEGICWFPVVDSTDWNSLLSRCEGQIDPVGVYWLDADLSRNPSVMSETYGLAARGVSSSVLPAFRFAEPVATWLAGYLPQMAHWTWLETPPGDVGRNVPPTASRLELRIVDAH
ncbi:MAG: hypothetical protein JWQ43_1487 [Glaciihabitans sp.]|nr:hypothetical protein [Glaciihabitans sp.]